MLERKIDESGNLSLAEICARAVLPRPELSRPIVILGAGGIVRVAHLPAYRKAGFEVAALVDSDREKAVSLAREFDIPCGTSSLDEAVRFAPRNCIFDIAVPASSLFHVLETLPNGSAVLLQKPFGRTFEEAKALLALCRQKGLVAAVNFQLRWAPVMCVARELHRAGFLGTLHDMEVQVSVNTPWEMWPFLQDVPRLEILYHSVHYIDLIRSWLGDPLSVYAKTTRNPATPQLEATKTVIILDYGDWTRVYLSTNHGHDFGSQKRRSFVQWEGTDAALHATMGAILSYPTGEPDRLQMAKRGGDWQPIPISGNWFPDAFAGSMSRLQSYINGADAELPNSVEDAITTMRVVEAAYLSSAQGGVSLALEEQGI